MTKLGFKEITPTNWLEADEISARFVQISSEGTVTPMTGDDWLQSILKPQWDAARHLRNIASHPTNQTILPPGMALTFLYRTADDINALFSHSIALEETAMPKQPEFHKYLPLEEWFRNQPTTPEQIELTFDQVEAILGEPLPKSATKLTTWWTNVQPKIQYHRTAWLNNGWKVSTARPGETGSRDRCFS
jgi:hypothetical protein